MTLKSSSLKNFLTFKMLWIVSILKEVKLHVQLLSMVILQIIWELSLNIIRQANSKSVNGILYRIGTKIVTGQDTLLQIHS